MSWKRSPLRAFANYIGCFTATLDAIFTCTCDGRPTSNDHVLLGRDATARGRLLMRAECLSFREIPHTTPLFSDYLYDFDRVQDFYPRAPLTIDWVGAELSHLRYDPERRSRVAAVLERQNRNWGASPKTLENIERFRRGAAAVVTGQQVTLFGGPLFAFYKALTAIKTADHLTSTGVDAVPVFWLATEDHDLAEVNQISLPENGSFRNLVAPSVGREDAPISDVRFADGIRLLVSSATELLGQNESTEILAELYSPSASFGDAFARLFARLFRNWGVVLVDAADPELHAIAIPVYRAAVVGAGDVTAALLERGRRLRARGYHEQVKVAPSSTLLFVINNGVRLPIHRHDAIGSGEVFAVDAEKLSAQELLARVEASPQDFSANVLLRPVVQDYLLPTIAYVGGPAEVAYFAQAGVVYQELLGRVTPILPRFSAMLIEAKAQRLLEKYQIRVADLFHGPDELKQKIAVSMLPGEMRTRFSRAKTAVGSAMSELKVALEQLDPTLVEAASRSEAKMQYQFERLQSRAARAELRRHNEFSRHAEQLCAWIYPNKTLQERELPGIVFLARYGDSLLESLYSHVHFACPDHQLIWLD